MRNTPRSDLQHDVAGEALGVQITPKQGDHHDKYRCDKIENVVL